MIEKWKSRLKHECLKVAKRISGVGENGTSKAATIQFHLEPLLLEIVSEYEIRLEGYREAMREIVGMKLRVYLEARAEEEATLAAPPARKET